MKFICSTPSVHHFIITLELKIIIPSKTTFPVRFHTPDHGGPSSPGTQKDSLPSSRITGATAIFFICGIYGCSNQYAFLSSISLHLHDSHLPCKLEVSDFFFRYSLSHGFPHDRNNLRSPDVPAGLCHKAFHYPQRHNHTS